MKNKRLFFFLVFIIAILSFNFFNSNMFYNSLLDFYITEINDDIISVETHGINNTHIVYRFLYLLGKDKSFLLEKYFFDTTKSNLFYQDYRLSKGDVAWFLYSDINFNEAFYDSMLLEFDFSYAQETFIKTLHDNTLRKDILEFFKRNEK